MLLKIDFNENQVIGRSNGRLILNLDYYAEYATGPHLCTVKGSTPEEFDDNPVLKEKTIYIGSRGGIFAEK
jgi:hypothetical protein